MKSPRKTKRALIYHYSFLLDVIQRTQHLKSHERRVAVSVICAGKLLKKHRLLSSLHRDTGLRGRNHGHKKLNMNKQRFRIAHTHTKRKAVESFFQRDDVSRTTAGKKRDSDTWAGEKKTETLFAWSFMHVAANNELLCKVASSEKYETS